MSPAPPRATGLERHGRFAALLQALPEDALVVADAKVLRLHPQAARALAHRPLVPVRAGERLKTLATVERLLRAMRGVSRHGTLCAVGGGTVGDTCAVAAHLHKRGIRLIHVPTTALAAVDSSVGGKGAVDLSAGREVFKNAVGVFHFPAETWLCPEFFTTLSPRQLAEGRTEAWKMFACLDARAWQDFGARSRPPAEWVRAGRALKAQVCARDPLEQLGPRAVLNFGHTLGHALESASDFRLSHGEAVGLGVRCALDVGRVLEVTPSLLAARVELGFQRGAAIPSRARMAQVLRKAGPARVQRLLAADKKRGPGGGGKMVLLEELGRARVHPVPDAVPLALLPWWQSGRRP